MRPEVRQPRESTEVGAVPDLDGKTLRLGLRLIEILGECVSNVKEPPQT
jgi:hypothetical protein